MLGGRVYTGAILHTGAALKLREAWSGTVTPGRGALEANTRRPAIGTPPAAVEPIVPARGKTNAFRAKGVLLGVAAVLGATGFAFSGDFILGLAAGAAFYALAFRVVDARQHAQG